MKRWGLYCWILSCAASIALRLQVVSKISWNQAVEEGVWLGFLNDICFATLPFALCLVLRPLLRRATWILYLVLFGTSFFAQYASALYFEFFGSKLHLWIVQLHWKDSFALPSVAADLSSSRWFFVACGSALLSAFFSYLYFRKSKGWTQMLLGWVAVALAAYLQQWPVNHRATINAWHGNRHNIVELRAPAYDHVLIHWLSDLDPRAKLSNQRGVLTQHLDEAIRTEPWRLVSSYRTAQSVRELLPQDSNNRLLRPLGNQPKLTRAWLKKLGFQSPPRNLVVLYVESLRAYDYFHPQWGKLVFPRLHELSSRHGVTFEQLYSSAWSAGQTVRGTFTTNCSFYENVLGPATVIANYQTRFRCAQRIFSERGASTVFFSPTTPTFHNKRAFEERQGTQIVLGPRDYLDPSIAPSDTEVFGNRDPQIYPALLRELNRLAESKKPFFVHSINLSTHTPWPELPDLQFRRKNPQVDWSTDPTVRGYQDVFHRWDAEFGRFMDQALAAPWADETLFLILGDHSIPVPHKAIHDVAAQDMRFRIPGILLSSALSKGSRIREPIHQVDLMPTALAILGFDKDPSTFLGRVIPPSGGAGSLWIYKEEDSKLSFREQNRYCLGALNGRVQCYKIPESQDPMYSEVTAIEDASAAETQQAMAFLESINLVIGRDQVLPRENSIPAKEAGVKPSP